MASIVVKNGGRLILSHNRLDGAHIGPGGRLDADNVDASNNGRHGLNVLGDGQASVRDLTATGNGGAGVNVEGAAEEVRRAVDWNGDAPSIETLASFIREVAKGEHEGTPEATVQAAAKRIGLLGFITDRGISMTALAASLAQLGVAIWSAK